MFSSFGNKIIGDSDQIKKDILDSKDEVIVEKIGVMGKVAFIKSEDQEKLRSLIELLDATPEGRSPLNSLTSFLGGSPLITRTDKNAIKQHQFMALNLSQVKRYLELGLAEFKKYIAANSKSNLRDAIYKPLINTYAKGLFNFDSIPDNFNTALETLIGVANSTMDSFAFNISLILFGSKHPTALSMMTFLSRSKYQNAVSSYLSSQGDSILADLHAHGAEEITTKNWLSRCVIQLIKEKNPAFENDNQALLNFLKTIDKKSLAQYLHDEAIETLPAMLLPTINNMILTCCALVALYEDTELLAQFRQALSDANITNDALEHPEELMHLMETDKKANGLLHRMYVESTRRESMLKSPEHLRFETITWRYASEGVKFGDTDIPAKTPIAILPAFQRFNAERFPEPEKFNPTRFFKEPEKERYAQSIFSFGNRLCPSHRLSEFLFKQIIAFAALNYDIKLDRKNKNEMHEQNIDIEFVPYQVKQEEKEEKRAQYRPF